jgi:hypothetical protein
MYRQETHSASLIVDDARHATQDPEVELGTRLYKLWGRQAGEEIYTLALAGDGELPDVPGAAVLGAPLDTKRFYERMAQLEHRALLSEASLAPTKGQVEQLSSERDRARRALDDAERDRLAAQRALAAHEASLSWRITEPLRLAKHALERVRSGRLR